MMKCLIAIALLASASAFAEIECHNEGAHGVVCHNPDMAHMPGDTTAQRVQYHLDRLHLMLLSIEGKEPLEPLPAFSKELPPMERTKADPRQLQLDLDLGDDISTKLQEGRR